jgi:hypothetical protein
MQIDTAEVYLSGNSITSNVEDLYLLQIDYPKCTMNYETNTLIVRSLYTSFDSNNIVTSYEEFKNNDKLKSELLSCISSTTEYAT